MIFTNSCSESEEDLIDNTNVDLLQEISAISKSVTCENPSEWEIVRFGYNDCFGGPTQNMLFHSSVNNEELQSKITEFTELEKRKAESDDFEVVCVSPAPPDFLRTITTVIECVEEEAKIATKTELETKYLVGEWGLFLSRQKNNVEIEGGEKVLHFNDDGTFSLISPDCESEGTYNFSEITRDVTLSFANCNESAQIEMRYEVDVLELYYNCETDTDICYENYNKVVFLE